MQRVFSKLFGNRCWILAGLLVGLAQTAVTHAADPAERPNILFCIADDWGWPHAGAYGDAAVKTPVFDRLAKEGILFRNAFVTSPSCTPSRGSILTGEMHWRLEAGANLWCTFPDKFTTYPDILAKSGYAVGTSGKAWGPGETETADRQIAGKPYKNFRSFLAKRSMDRPFCYWLGSSDPHRPYDTGSGKASGIDLDKVKLPPEYPDAEVIRSDVADYYFEVQRFDSLVGDAVAALEAAGEFENTVVVVTGDHGWPFPRGKGNLYDSGVHVPLAICWGSRVKPGRTVDDFVSLSDLARTFLELAGVPRPEEMTGKSLVNVLLSDQSGQVDTKRDHVIFGKERHVPCQESPDMGGYPCRGLRTQEFLYIRNFTPERWPVGTPDWQKATIRGVWLGDTDNGPTKSYLVENQDRDESHRRAYNWSFGKRPAEELYDLSKDPDELVNVAAVPEFASIKAEYGQRLLEELKQTGDWRADWVTAKITLSTAIQAKVRDIPILGRDGAYSRKIDRRTGSGRSQVRFVGFPDHRARLRIFTRCWRRRFAELPIGMLIPPGGGINRFPSSVGATLLQCFCEFFARAKPILASLGKAFHNQRFKVF